MLNCLGPLARRVVVGPQPRLGLQPSTTTRSRLLPRSVVSAHFTLRHASSKKSSSKKAVFSLDDMPTFKQDELGLDVGPLDDITKANRPKQKGSRAIGGKGNAEANDAAEPEFDGITAEEEDDFLAAHRAGRVPESPLARQVWANAKRFPDCVLLTQVGHFYESYFEPAIEVSAILGTKLTSKKYKTGRYPFTGFPTSQLDKYLKILVQDLGRTVVLVDELVDPLNPAAKPTNKEMALRKVARVVTPGTLIDDSWLSGNESRYLLAIAVGEAAPAPTVDHDTRYPIYLAYADVSTGEFFTKEATTADIEDELARITPREVVLDARWRDLWLNTESEQENGQVMAGVLSLLRALGAHVSFTQPAMAADEASTRKSGYSSSTLERAAIRILHHHLEYALRSNLPSMPENPEDYNRESSTTQMHIDAATLQALEVKHSISLGGLAPGEALSRATPVSSKGTLLSVISRTITDSGNRLLRRTLAAPSTDLAAINSRLDLVTAFVNREPLRTDVRLALRSVADVMRIIQRFRARRGEGLDVWEVGKWVRSVELILDRMLVDISHNGKTARQASSEQDKEVDRLSKLVAAFSPLKDLASDIESAIDESKLSSLQQAESDADSDDLDATPGPPVIRMKGQTRQEQIERQKAERYWVQPSFSEELAALHNRLNRLLKKEETLQRTLRRELKADTLTLARSQRHGYVVSVSKKNQFGAVDRADQFHAVGSSSTSKMWVLNEWSELAKLIDDTFVELDAAQWQSLNRLRAMVVERAPAIQHNAELLDEIDLTAGFAQVAVDRNFVRPAMDNGVELKIVNGRHPSVEAGLEASSRMFTPNSTVMNPDSHLHVITGPNQGGKSTLLRQTAVIAIMAQAGSFVPADAAHIGIVDRVFSRIGARDDLFRDRSTFMLEMVETAAILKHATPKSLVIMDEIGRGTTLHAGMSIAYATLDYLLQNVKCRTLFATHYHELASMLGAPVRKPGDEGIAVVDQKEVRPGVEFWCTDVDERDGLFAYSYHLKPGINYESHAIKAAQLAGMPQSFLETAERTLQTLNTTSHSAT